MAKMISTAEAAARMGVTRLRVQQLCRARRIPGARLMGGRTWMLPENFNVNPGARGPALGSKTRTLC